MFDHNCGPLTYNSHAGIDFRVTSRQKKHGAYAAADGTVIRVKVAPMGGNYIALDHGHGWQTHYFHLQPGSMEVKKGDVVKTGDKLANLGASGRSLGTDSLHFNLVYREKKKDPLSLFDPFTGLPVQSLEKCDDLVPRHLFWTEKAMKVLLQRAGGNSRFSEVHSVQAITGATKYALVDVKENMLTTLGNDVLFKVKIRGIYAGDSYVFSLKQGGKVLKKVTRHMLTSKAVPYELSLLVENAMMKEGQEYTLELKASQQENMDEIRWVRKYPLVVRSRK